MHHVKWEIDVDAESPQEAAQKAYDIQRRTGSTATVFTVTDPAGDEYTFDLPVIEHATPVRDILRDCLGAMDTLRHQVDQMRGMFPDEDGTIQEACDAHDETDAAVRGLLNAAPAISPTELHEGDKPVSGYSSAESAALHQTGLEKGPA